MATRPNSSVISSSSINPPSPKEAAFLLPLVKRIATLFASTQLEFTLLTSFLSISHLLMTRMKNFTWAVVGMTANLGVCIVIYINRIHLFALSHLAKNRISYMLLIVQVIGLGYLIQQAYAYFSKKQSPASTSPTTSSSLTSIVTSNTTANNTSATNSPTTPVKPIRSELSPIPASPKSPQLLINDYTELLQQCLVENQHKNAYELLKDLTKAKASLIRISPSHTLVIDQAFTNFKKKNEQQLTLDESRCKTVFLDDLNVTPPQSSSSTATTAPSEPNYYLQKAQQLLQTEKKLKMLFTDDASTQLIDSVLKNQFVDLFKGMDEKRSQSNENALTRVQYLHKQKDTLCTNLNKRQELVKRALEDFQKQNATIFTLTQEACKKVFKDALDSISSQSSSSTATTVPADSHYLQKASTLIDTEKSLKMPFTDNTSAQLIDSVLKNQFVDLFKEMDEKRSKSNENALTHVQYLQKQKEALCTNCAKYQGIVKSAFEEFQRQNSEIFKLTAEKCTALLSHIENGIQIFSEKVKALLQISTALKKEFPSDVKIIDDQLKQKCFDLFHTIYLSIVQNDSKGNILSHLKSFESEIQALITSCGAENGPFISTYYEDYKKSEKFPKLTEENCKQCFQDDISKNLDTVFAQITSLIDYFTPEDSTASIVFTALRAKLPLALEKDLSKRLLVLFCYKIFGSIYLKNIGIISYSDVLETLNKVITKLNPKSIQDHICQTVFNTCKTSFGLTSPSSFRPDSFESTQTINPLLARAKTNQCLPLLTKAHGLYFTKARIQQQLDTTKFHNFLCEAHQNFVTSFNAELIKTMAELQNKLQLTQDEIAAIQNIQ